jgi:hypothetical protein
MKCRPDCIFGTLYPSFGHKFAHPCHRAIAIIPIKGNNFKGSPHFWPLPSPLLYACLQSLSLVYTFTLATVPHVTSPDHSAMLSCHSDCPLRGSYLLRSKFLNFATASEIASHLFLFSPSLQGRTLQPYHNYRLRLTCI